MKTNLLILSSLFLLQACSDNPKALVTEDTTTTTTTTSEVKTFVNRFSGKGESYTYATAQDDDGNMYVGGNFKNDSADTNEFKDISGNQLLGLSSTLTTDGYIMKLDKDGNQKWIKVIGGAGADSVQGVTTDGTNVYVIGKFAESSARANAAVDFLGANLAGVSTGGASEDIFVAKLNANGEQQWIKILGGNDTVEANTDIPMSVIIGSSNYIYISGLYYNDSTNTRSAVDFAGNQLNGKSATRSQDGFVAKLAAADGAQSWIKTLGGTGGDRVYRIAQDSTGAIIVPGQYVNSTTNPRSVLDFSNSRFDGITTTNSTDGFLAKLNNDGTQAWIKGYGGTTHNDFLDAAIVDSSDNIFVAGSFGNDDINTNLAKDFAGNQLDGVTGTSSRDILFAKLASDGTQTWIKTMGGTGSDRAQGLGKDSTGNVYVAGYFNNNTADGTTGLDFLGTTLLGKSAGAVSVDGFLTKLDSSGTQQWIKLMGGSASDVIEGMSVDKNGNVGVVGYLQNDSSDTNSVTDFSGNALPGRTTSTVSTGFMIRYSGP